MVAHGLGEALEHLTRDAYVHQGQIHPEAAKPPLSVTRLVSLGLLQERWAPPLGMSSGRAPQVLLCSAVP